MSKIVVIKGSDRKGSNTSAMADAFIAAAREAGHEVTEHNAMSMDLNGCHGCYTCYKTGKPCSFDDDFNEIADELLAADGWVFSFPIFWYGIPGKTKLLLDNTFCFVVGHKDFTGKKLALLSCCEEDDPTVFEGARVPFERSARMCHWDLVGEVLVPGVNEPGDIEKTDGLARAAALAARF